MDSVRSILGYAYLLVATLYGNGAGRCLRGTSGVSHVENRSEVDRRRVDYGLEVVVDFNGAAAAHDHIPGNSTSPARGNDIIGQLSSGMIGPSAKD